MFALLSTFLLCFELVSAGYWSISYNRDGVRTASQSGYGLCIQTYAYPGRYGNSQGATFYAYGGGTVRMNAFSVEGYFDRLSFQSNWQWRPAVGSTWNWSHLYSPWGWYTDSSVTYNGWQMCYTLAPCNNAICNGRGTCVSATTCTCNANWAGATCTYCETGFGPAGVCSGYIGGGTGSNWIVPVTQVGTASGHCRLVTDATRPCIQTNGYPGAYQNSMSCTWQFGGTGNLQVLSFSAEGYFDRLSYSGNEQWRPSAGTIFTNPMGYNNWGWVSDSSVVYYGFRLCLTAGCTAASTCNSHGTCSGSSCVCYFNFAGANCDTCRSGFTGYGSCTTCVANYWPVCSTSGSCCATYCLASSTCSGHGTCNSNGACVCAAGWGGTSCNTCTRTCNGHGTCNSVGTCVCQIGFAGSDCEQCDAYYFSYPSCNQFCLSSATCSSAGFTRLDVTNTMNQCKGRIDAGRLCYTSPNYPSSYGNNERCSFSVQGSGTLLVTSYVGESCCDYLYTYSSTANRWQPVAGNTRSSPSAYNNWGWYSDGSVVYQGWQLCFSCDAATTCSGHGSCSASMTCTCSTGWSGSSCNVCASDYYPVGSCTTFCQGSSTCNNRGSCQANGLCSCTSTGWTGTNCNDCASYYYPSGTCNVFCNPATTCSGRGSCLANGLCSCNTGFAVPSCSSCSANYYPASSCTSYCLASTTCNGHGTCSTSNGACLCNTQWTGSTCNSCASGWYPAGTCNVQCERVSTCSNHGNCDTNGGCVCDTGFTGASCNACASGYYGSSCLACPGGSTNPCNGYGSCGAGISGNGLCTCNSFYAGTECQFSDSVTCNGHGTAQSTGACICAVGFSGATCQLCASNYWNFPQCTYCVSATTCNGHGACNALGSCNCATQFTGPSCASCATNYFNYPTCSYCLNSVTCSGRGTCTSTGSCQCNAGVEGSSCSTCAAGYFAPSVSDVECSRCPGPTSVLQPCFSLGVCDRGPSSNGFGGAGSCSCSTPYTGPACVDPVLISLSQTTGIPLSGGTVLTLSGYFVRCNLAFQPGCSTPSTIEVGSEPSTTCAITSITDTRITCTLPPLHPANDGQAAVTIRRGDNVQSNAISIGFASPSITGMSPLNGPVAGSVTITLEGANFGTGGFINVGSVVIQSGDAVTWSNTQITFAKPQGLGAVPVTVTTATRTSNSKTFTYDEILINSVSPLTPFATLGNELLTISGLNFGTDSTPPISTPFSVTIGGRAVVQVVSRADGTLLVRTPTGVGLQQLRVTVGSTTRTDTVTFEGPEATGITASGGDCEINGGGVFNCNQTGGETITVIGTNFGPSPDAQGSVPALTVNLGEKDCPIVSMPTAHTHVVCTVPAGSGKSVVITVSRGPTQTSSTPGLFGYAGPTLIEGTLVFVANLQSTGKRASLQSRGVALQVIKIINADDTFTDRTVQFEGTDFCQEPTVCVVADTTVYYGPSENPRKYTCTITELTNFQIRCTISGGVGRNLHFSVNSRFGGISDQGADFLNYPAPTIIPLTLRVTGLSPNPDGTIFSATTLGELVEFEATNIGTNAADVQVTYGQTEDRSEKVCSVTYVNDSAVQCRTDPGQGLSWRFKVMVGAEASTMQSGNGTDMYNYKAAPNVTSISSNGGCTDGVTTVSDCPTDGMTADGSRVRLTLRGTNFGGDLSMSVGIGSRTCSRLTVNVNLPDNEVYCDLPAGVGSPSMVLSRLEGGAVYSRPVTMVSYAAPVIANITGCPVQEGGNAVDCPRVGGTVLTLSGTNFGLESTPPTVLIAGNPCQNVQQVNDEQVTCTSNAGTLSGVTLLLIQASGGFQSNANLEVSYKQCERGTFAGFGVVDCANCSAGTYAGLTGQIQCLSCDVGSFSVEGSSICTKCALGTYAGSTGSSACAPCAAGTYADNSGMMQCLPTVQGYFSSEGAEAPVPCAMGYFSNATYMSYCYPCEAGTFSAFTAQAGCPSCPSGKYNSFPGQTACVNCELGRFAQSPGFTSCTLCAAGYYAAQVGQARCSACPRGRVQANTGMSVCVDCTRGQYNDQSAQTECTPCANGTYSEALGRAQPCTPCAAGKYQPAEGQLTCLNCATGRFQGTYGQLDCMDCPEGRYQNTPAQLACDFCPPGTYIDQPAEVACVSCPAGKFSEFGLDQGASVCFDCPVGRFTLATGLGECSACQPGKYANETANIACTSCPFGTYSDTVATVNCLICPEGRFGATSNLLECLECQLGRFNAQTAATSCTACPDGTHQTNAGSVDCVDCPPGYFSFSGNSGNAFCSPCPSGSFNNQSGETSCVLCESGKFSVYNFATGTEECSECQPGYYNAGTGANRCLPCPGGYFSNTTGAVVCQICAPGTAQDRGGQTECLDCGTGRFATTPAQITCFECAQGFYMADLGATQCTPCGVGLYSDFQAATACEQCPAGQKNPFNGSALCYLCDAGRYQPNIGSTSCIAAAPGFFVERQGQEEQGQCGAGYFSNANGSSVCSPCPRGCYGSQLGATVCPVCLAGSYSATQASTSCVSCAAGTYNALPGQVVCSSCPAGRYNLANGFTFCQECEAGKFQPLVGQIGCTTCPDGSVALQTAQTVCSLCEAGKFLLIPENVTKTGNETCTPCPVGKYGNSTGASSCLSCPPGTYTSVPSQTGCLPCPAGSYSTESDSVSCTQCPGGSFQDREGQSECRLCPGGHASSVLGQTLLNCPECQPGTFSKNEGNEFCTSCPPGKFERNSSSTDCESCPTGRFSAAVALDTSCPICPEGKYSDSPASLECESCLVGEFQEQVGQESCDLCPVGRYSTIEVSSFCARCDPGWYQAVPGQTQCFQCEPGKGQTENSPRTSCEFCTPGKYSPGGLDVCEACGANTVVNHSKAEKCYVCDSNSRSNAQLTECLCKIGYFTYGEFNLTAGAEIVCLPCPDGANCLEEGTTFDNMQTLPGWWRPSQTSLDFVKCLVPENCAGGRLAACGDNREGPACARCAKGTRAITTVSSCDVCPEKSVALMATIIILAIMVLLLVAMFAMVLRADQNLHAIAKKHDTKRRNIDASAVKDSKVRSVRAQLAHLDEEALNAHDDVLAHLTNDWLKDDTAVSPPVLTDESRRWGPNFTTKLKIMLGWAQIVTNLTYWLDVSWPSQYRYIVAYFNVVNMDFVPWQTLECAVEIDFYVKFFTVTLTPIALALCVFLFYALPRMLAARAHSDADKKHHSRKYSLRQWNRMLIFLCFLVYPGVSARVMSYFLTKEIDGKVYLRADFNVMYKDEYGKIDEEWEKWLWYALLTVVLYPVGIPIGFALVLYRNRSRLMWPSVRIRLGMIYAAYHDKAWWFELLDLINKLFLCAGVVFVPLEWSVRAAMLWVGIFLGVSLNLTPFIRKGDDRLYLLCQVETFLILISAAVLTNIQKNTFDEGADWFFSLLCFIISGFVIAAFITMTGKNMKKLLTMKKSGVKGNGVETDEDEEEIDIGAEENADALASLDNSNTFRNPEALDDSPTESAAEETAGDTSDGVRPAKTAQTYDVDEGGDGDEVRSAEPAQTNDVNDEDDDI